MSVRTFKERIVKEAYDQGVEYTLNVDRLVRAVSLSITWSSWSHDFEVYMSMGYLGLIDFFCCKL